MLRVVIAAALALLLTLHAPAASAVDSNSYLFQEYFPSWNFDDNWDVPSWAADRVSQSYACEGFSQGGVAVLEGSAGFTYMERKVDATKRAAGDVWIRLVGDDADCPGAGGQDNGWVTVTVKSFSSAGGWTSRSMQVTEAQLSADQFTHFSVSSSTMSPPDTYVAAALEIWTSGVDIVVDSARLWEEGGISSGSVSTRVDRETRIFGFTSIGDGTCDPTSLLCKEDGTWIIDHGQPMHASTGGAQVDEASVYAGASASAAGHHVDARIDSSSTSGRNYLLVDGEWIGTVRPQ